MIYDAEPVIKVENLCKYYGRRKKVKAVCDVSFAVNRGEIFGVIGPDGAGKTSIIQILSGVLSSSEGKASVAGIDVIKDPEAVKGIIGYMPQGLGLNLYDSLSVAENIAFFRDLRQVPLEVYERNRRELLNITRLEPFLGRQARHLSGGMRQKLALICTLIHLPDILLLDEPTTGVDPISRQDFWMIVHRLVRERQVTVLLTTSYMDEAERCHRVALLHEGKIIQHGEPESLRAKAGGGHFRLIARPQHNALRLLRSWDGVKSSGVFGEEIRLSLKAQEKELLSYLSEKGIEVKEITPYEAGLEEVFVQLISGQEPKIMADSSNPSIQLSTPDPKIFDDKIVIQCNSVIRRFNDFVAVDKVDLSVTKGEVFGLLGPNGAGKTTLIKMMCGLLEPNEGIIKVAGFDVLKQRRDVWTHVGYMSQRFSLYRDLTVEENLRLYAGLYGVKNKDFKKGIEFLGLSGMEDRLTRNLPLGMKQRLALACALLHEPPVLFLDEPTSGVDPLARRSFWEIIYSLSRESGVTVIVSTHYMDEAEHCDRLGLMHQGRLIAIGTPSELKEASEKRSGRLLSIKTSDFRNAFDLIISIFPNATLYGSRIHLRTFNPESDKERVIKYLTDARITDVKTGIQPLSMQETFVDHIMAAEEVHA
ncbi:ABC transporter ATP-binding protein [hot springs metagenome]|uniref:ABC transporter ATP-binding protein n=1 Tax=hot springs metagenome TaxID=433727 RepID=A0A5J4KUG0_9ZZZZ